MIEFGLHGKPLGPTGCFIGATAFAVAACWFLAYALHPKWRGTSRWGKRGQGGPMSLVGSLAWVLNALLWGIAMLAQGLEYSPIVTRTGWILGAGFVALIVIAIRDSIHNRSR
jgi:hypothetical protein